ncbi:MAG TPA: hypothetical protein DD648_05910 [Candidatus Omnitrophica bacterium]|nr:hypothetical protein [Candidatus Omnitrophota bacterium]
MRILRKSLTIFVLAAVIVVPPAFADEEIERLKSEMQSMRETVTRLQETIARMQGVIEKYDQQPKVEAPRPAAVAATGDVEDLRSEVDDLKDDIAKFMKISGYYDFEWLMDDKEASPNEFKQHHLSFFFDKRIEDWHFFSELEFEYAFDYAGTGGGVTGGGEAKVETTWLEYNHGDLFNIRGGKLLRPQYWTANHYPSQTVSTSRPLLVKNVIPFDTTGVSVYGTKYFKNEWGGSYNLFVGNGEAADRAKDDANEDKVFGGKLTAHMPFFDRFDVAGSTYIGSNAASKSEWMWGAEAQIDIANFGLLAEVAHNNNEGQFGYYVQPSYRFLPKWTTFYRLDTRDDHNQIDDPDDSTRHTVGLRYQPLTAISLKGELYKDIPDDRTRERANGFISSVVIFF